MKEKIYRNIHSEPHTKLRRHISETPISTDFRSEIVLGAVNYEDTFLNNFDDTFSCFDTTYEIVILVQFGSLEAMPKEMV